MIGKREHGPDVLLKALMSTFSKAPSGPSSTTLSNKSLQATKSEKKKKKSHQCPKMSPAIVMCMPLHNYMLINWITEWKKRAAKFIAVDSSCSHLKAEAEASPCFPSKMRVCPT